jgi:hypothetical protein
MGLTPNHQLPYPEPADRPDITADLYELAKRLDDVLGDITARLEHVERALTHAYDKQELSEPL